MCPLFMHSLYFLRKWIIHYNASGVHCFCFVHWNVLHTNQYQMNYVCHIIFNYQRNLNFRFINSMSQYWTLLLPSCFSCNKFNSCFNEMSTWLVNIDYHLVDFVGLFRYFFLCFVFFLSLNVSFCHQLVPIF